MRPQRPRPPTGGSSARSRRWPKRGGPAISAAHRAAAIPRRPHRSRTCSLQRCSRPVSPVVSVAAAHAGPDTDRAALPRTRSPGISMCRSGSSAPRPSPSRRTPLSRASMLKDNDLRIEQHDISELPPGFLDDPAIAVGLTASRPISERRLHHQSTFAGRQGRAARPNRDPGRRCRRHERPHGGQGPERWPDQSTG